MPRNPPAIVDAILRAGPTLVVAKMALVSAYVLGGVVKASDFPGAVAEQAHFGQNPPALFATLTIVHPHALLVPRGPAPTPPAGPLRISYVGFPVAHKGWPVFRELALAFEGDPRYAFLHLGAQPEPGLPVAFHPVRVDGAHPRAMIDALEAHAIDIVVLWPLWRETFSFAAYEALAAGCAVVAGPDSGNIAALVAREGAGWVLPDEPALARALESGRILELSRAARRPMLYDLVLSGMTSDLIAADTPA